jgi:spoIIIJ-associated protein
MKDQIFTGKTVAEAIDVAGRTLGLSPDAIRYVVLEREAPGVRGMEGTAARIAVLLQEGGDPSHSDSATSAPKAEARPADSRASIRGLVRRFAEASGLDLSAEIQEDGERTIVRLDGGDRAFLIADGGEVLQALEHIIHRAFGRDLYPSRLLVECEGFREVRENALRERARELAREVREDGLPRETDPLNAYERRIIHMALTDEPGVRTFSVGEGSDRRVTVARKEEDTDPS